MRENQTAQLHPQELPGPIFGEAVVRSSSDRLAGPQPLAFLSGPRAVIFCLPVAAAVFAKLPSVAAFTVYEALLIVLVVLSIGSLLRSVMFWTWFNAMLVPILLMCVGQLIGLLDVGLQSWSIGPLIANVMAPLSLPILVAVLHDLPGAERIVAAGFRLTGVAISLFMLTEPSGRALGPFDNPNYAGHYLVACVLTVLVVTRGKLGPADLGMIAIFVLGILRSGSFSAPLMLVFAALPLLAQYAARRKVAVAGIVAVAVLAATLLSSGVVPGRNSLEDWGLNQARLERSFGDRSKLIVEAPGVILDRPFGLGPGGLDGRQLNTAIGRTEGEFHNDWADMAVQGGFLALAGLVALFRPVWSALRTDVYSRGLLYSLLFASLTRQTINFRHLWLVLALAIVINVRAGDPVVARRE